MAITRVKTSSILQNFPKERSMLAGNDGDTGAYESIATVTVTSGTASAFEFTNIPSTYQHLQLRIFVRPTAFLNEMTFTFNGDTSNSYTSHRIQGDGSSATAALRSNSSASMIFGILNVATSNCFSVMVMDILDYTNTNKFKTCRALSGSDQNGSGTMSFYSGLWNKTDAISSLRFITQGDTFAVNSTAALYGIR